MLRVKLRVKLRVPHHILSEDLRGHINPQFSLQRKHQNKFG